MKMKKEILKFSIFMLFIFFKCDGSTPPHIIFMLVDDLGWNDVSFHGSPQIPTPNIDTLAYTGIILNRYYVMPLCTPSRGSLMTGKHPIRLGLQHYVIAAGEPWGLSPNETLLPQHLKKLGYATHGIGKWHLGYFKNEYVPTNRGFDTFFGYYEGKGDYFTHFDVEDGQSGLDFSENGRPAWNYFTKYSTEVFTEKAEEIIKSHNSSQPLFLYISHQAVHAGNDDSPMQAPLEYINKFSHIPDQKRRTFAAMTSALDKSVGDVFAALSAKGMIENCIIIFSTDNGGAVQGIDSSTGSNWPLRGSKYNMWEGGVRATGFIWSPLLPNSNDIISNDLMHISDWLPTLYAAAGGNPEELGEIDGHNFWPYFNKHLPAPRDNILLNIDEHWNVEAVIKNNFKLLKGSTLDGKFDGWFDKEGHPEEGLHFSEKEMDIFQKVYEKHLHESKIYKILENDYNYDLKDKCVDCTKNVDFCDTSSGEIPECTTAEKVKQYSMHPFSQPVEVICGDKPANASTNCNIQEEYCLFDINKDPCEYLNLAHILPSVTEELKELLNNYRKKAIPIRNKERDPKANPKYHGYAWIPWAEKKSHIIL